MRQPYGRKIASTVVYAHPRWYAAQGYIVVIQDVRGRGTSTGDFQLFVQEATDGLETVNWAAQLPGSNGRVGMYGFSYQGMTQLYAASQAPPALKTICPAMLGYDLYQDWAYEGGAFCLQTNLAWAIQLAAESARRRQDEPAFLALSQAAQSLPLQDRVSSQPDRLQRLAPNSFYWEWLLHNNPADPYWQKLKPDLHQVDLPMLHIGGWFDTYLRGSLRLYREMQATKQSPQHLWIGPWAHLPWSQRVGALDYGPAAQSPIDQVQIRWFDHYLKDQDCLAREAGIDQTAPVQLFILGQNQWRSLPAWPQSQTKVLYLHSNGLAALRTDAGQLQVEPQADTSEDIWVHDPWRPVPALGGHATFPAGSCDRTALDSRSDVVTYTTPTLTQELEILGDLWLEVFCQADMPSFDLCGVLSEVNAQGVFNFSQGFLRVQTPAMQEPRSLKLHFQATAMVIPAGHALRLSLSAACFPAYAINPGTGENPDCSPRIQAQIITLRLRTGKQFPSRLCLGDEIAQPALGAAQR